MAADKTPQANIVKPVINIDDNTSLISSQVDKIFSVNTRKDDVSIKLLEKIEDNTNKLLSLFQKPSNTERRKKDKKIKAFQIQERKAKAVKPQRVVAKNEKKEKASPLKAVFDKEEADKLIPRSTEAQKPLNLDRPSENDSASTSEKPKSKTCIS